MNVTVSSTSVTSVDVDWLVAAVPEGQEWPSSLIALDNALVGQLSRLREAGDLTGKLAEVLTIPDTPTLKARRVLLVGIGAGRGSLGKGRDDRHASNFFKAECASCRRGSGIGRTHHR
jgi:leucyl aminopeptidase